jgi:general stress protein YciG
MAGTVTGGKQAAQTNKELYGERFYAEIGAKGGKARNPLKGFGSDRKRASEAGYKGGIKSRRPKATV